MRWDNISGSTLRDRRGLRWIAGAGTGSASENINLGPDLPRSRLTGGPGTTDNLDGPVNFAFDFAAYLVPLAVLELYLRGSAGTGARRKLLAAGALLAMTAYMIVGIFALTAAHLPSLR